MAGASITAQNQQMLQLAYDVKTGADGSVMLSDIPEGRYSYNITAPYHKPYSGSFVVQAGITTTVPLALQANLVNIEWSVTPVPLQDTYQITVNQTFETHVPTAVIVTEPAAIMLPRLKQGEVFNGEFTITNYGLVTATYEGIKFPTSFGDYDLEVLAAIPETLTAMQKVTVPYRVTRRIATAMLPLPSVGEGWSEGEALAFNSELYREVQGYGSGCYVTKGLRIINMNT